MNNTWIQNAFNAAGESASRITGMSYLFEVRAVDQIYAVRIVALNTADAWAAIGAVVSAFMDGPRGVRVSHIELVTQS